jgi:hypothetical protein
MVSSNFLTSVSDIKLTWEPRSNKVSIFVFSIQLLCGIVHFSFDHPHVVHLNNLNMHKNNLYLASQLL